MSDQDQSHTSGQGQARETASSSAEQRAGGAGERGARHGRRRRRERTSSSQGQARRSEGSFDMEELRELTELFTTHGLTDFEFENAEIRIRLSRNPTPQGGGVVVAPMIPAAPAASLAGAAAAQATPAPTSAAETATPAAAAATESAETSDSAQGKTAGEELHIITSPIVGTFYRSPSPTAEAFVRVGSRVEADTVVCIIEAMKLMNEIQAETSGVIEKIYVENGQPVEYGQPLFGLRK